MAAVLAGAVGGASYLCCRHFQSCVFRLAGRRGVTAIVVARRLFAGIPFVTMAQSGGKKREVRYHPI